MIKGNKGLGMERVYAIRLFAICMMVAEFLQSMYSTYTSLTVRTLHRYQFGTIQGMLN